jgi:hypothetical protein
MAGEQYMKRRYTQKEADDICERFYQLLSADKIVLVVPGMQHLVDALPKVRHKGGHIDMDTISDDILQELKTMNMLANNLPSDGEIAEHLMKQDQQDLTPEN